MANPFYSYSNNFLPGTPARAEAIAAEYTRVQTGFSLLVTQGVDSGAANAYVVTTQGQPAGAYQDGNTVSFKPLAANTGASTINVNSIGAVQLVRFNGAALIAGDVSANVWVTVVYNTAFSAFTLIGTNQTALIPGTISSAAPSHKVGLTAAGGASTAAAPIDATFAIDQSIAPTWTSIHTFSPPGGGDAVVANGNSTAYEFKAGGQTGGYTLWAPQFHANWNVVQTSIPYNPTEWQVYSNAAMGIAQTQIGTNQVVLISGTAFDPAWIGFPYLFINGVGYKVASVTDGSHLTVQTTSGGAVSWGSTTNYTYYFVATTVTAVCNTNGTAVSWVSGQLFIGEGATCIINGVTYSIASFNSPTSITLTTSAGTQTGVSYRQDDNIGPRAAGAELSTMRLQGLAGANEEGFVITFNPVGTYLQSFQAGAGQYRPIFLETGEAPAGTAQCFISMRPNATLGLNGVMGLGGDTAAGNQAITVNMLATAVNQLSVGGVVSGSAPFISGRGTDTNVGLGFDCQGTGAVTFTSHAFTNTEFQVLAGGGSSWLAVTSSSSAFPAIQAAGAASNVNISLIPKGSGVVACSNNVSLTPAAGVVGLSITTASGTNGISITGVGATTGIAVTGAAATQTAVLSMQQSGQSQWFLISPASSNNLGFYTAGAAVLTLGGAGNVTIAAPTSSATALTVAGIASNPAGVFSGAAGTGVSQGVFINAGTNSSDFGLAISNAANTVQLAKFFGDASFQIGKSNALSGSAAGNITIAAPTSGVGLTVSGFAGSSALQINTAGVQVGSPTGGDQGSGTINVATGLYINGNPVYAGIPQNSQAASYTTVLADANKHIRTTGTTAAQTLTIAANASVAYPAGTLITFCNRSTQSWSIAINSDTLTWAVNNTSGTRTLAAGGMASALKTDSTVWLISGAGLS